MGIPNSWMVYKGESSYKCMITRGSSNLGNPYVFTSYNLLRSGEVANCLVVNIPQLGLSDMCGLFSWLIASCQVGCTSTELLGHFRLHDIWYSILAIRNHALKDAFIGQ